MMSLKCEKTHKIWIPISQDLFLMTVNIAGDSVIWTTLRPLHLDIFLAFHGGDW